MTRAPRADLMALTEDSLAALANRGLVKRAAKDLAAGLGARVAADAEGTLTGDYPDGVVTGLRADSPLTEATCSCSAAGVCRHRVGLVLAYQKLHADHAPEQEPQADSNADAEPAVRWSPGDIADETLVRTLGGRAVEDARRSLKRGVEAVVHRLGASRKPRVELPACTVTFHIPGDPAYATTDAADLKRGEAVALAVWAFREADTLGLDGESVHVYVGGGGAGGAGGAESSGAEAAAKALAHAADLVESLVLDGVSTTGPLLIGNLRRSARDLAAASLLWPAAIVGELVTQLDWYEQRSARYELTRLADLATELLGRRRAAEAVASGTVAVSPVSERGLGSQGPSLAQILGTAEPARTPLRRIRLIGLGCRLHGGPQHRTAELYFAHPHDGTVLVWRREWKFDETEQPPDGPRLRMRRVAGTPLFMLGACNLVSESASRSASRTVEFGTSRLGKTTVTALGEAWRQLPESVSARDFAALAERLSARQPRYLRPRVEAEDIHVLTVAEVERVGYDPAAQCLEAVVRDAQGTAARVRAFYRSVCPAALDDLGAALTAAAPEPGGGSPMMISGRVAVRAGELVVEPLAVWSGGTGQPIVPDLAAGEDAGGLPLGGRRVDEDAVTAPLHTAVEMLAEHAHRGLDRAGEASKTAIEQVAASLSRTGFKALAALFAAYGGSLERDDRAARARAWTDASITALACLESTG